MKKLILISILFTLTISSFAQYTGEQVYNYVKNNAVKQDKKITYKWKKLAVKEKGNKSISDNTLWYTKPYRLSEDEYKLALDSTIERKNSIVKTTRKFQLAIYRNKKKVIEQRLKIIRKVDVQKSKHEQMQMLFDYYDKNPLPDSVFFEAGDRILGLYIEPVITDTITPDTIIN